MKNSLYLRSGLVVLVLLAAIPAVLGATTITGPTVISSPGTYVLAKDITGGKSPAIWVKSSGVTIDGNGHLIDGNDASSSFGILVNNPGTTLTGVTIKNVRVQDWHFGVYLKGVASSTVTGVTGTSNKKAAISLRESSRNTISGCTAAGNEQGIHLWANCDGNTITGNTMKDNSDMGLWLAGTGRTGSGIVYDSTGNTVTNNVVSGNRFGLYLDFTRDNTVSNNKANNNDNHGIFLDYSSGNKLIGNSACGHSQSGIVLFDSDGCTISGNTATGNGDYGLWAIESVSLSLGSNGFSGNSAGTHKLSGGSTASGSASQTSGGVTPTARVSTPAPATSEAQTNALSKAVATPTIEKTTATQPSSGSAAITVTPATAKKGAAVKFTVKPAAGKTIKSVWWSFDADKHLNSWNARSTSPTFFYPSTGTFSPLVKITYTDNSVAEVKLSKYVKIS